MGIVVEDLHFEQPGACIMVVQREPDELPEPWRIVQLDIETMSALTPVEVRRLGHWLVREGKRIGREYKSNGCKRGLSNAVAQPTERR